VTKDGILLRFYEIKLYNFH